MGIFDKNDLEVVPTNYKAQFIFNHPTVDMNRTIEKQYGTSNSLEYSSGQERILRYESPQIERTKHHDKNKRIVSLYQYNIYDI